MTLYTIDFGFDLNAAPIGANFGSPSRFLPLQLNMVDESTGQAAWPTQLMAGDEIRFCVTDITSAEGETPDDVADTWSADGPVQGYVPNSLKGLTLDPDGDPVTPFVGLSESFLLFYSPDFAYQSEGPPQSAVYNAVNPDWKLAIWYVEWEGQQQWELQDTSAFYKFSFYLKVLQDGGGSVTAKEFIVDPEMFVGGGDEGD